MQTTLDFIHAVENNHESQVHLNSNRDRFSKQCQDLLSILRTGAKLSVKEAMVYHGINSLPRRVLDLKQAGVNIKDEWVIVDGEQKHKVYYL